MSDPSLLDAEHLRQILDASLAVTRAVPGATPEELAELALGCALDLVPADHAAFFVLDPLTDEAVRLTWRAREAPKPVRFAPGAGAVGWSLANHAPLLITDARRDPRFQPVRYPASRSLITVPLEHRGQPLGALCCSSHAADAFQSVHVEALRLFGEHVAAAFAVTRGAGAAGDESMIPARVLSEYAHEVRGSLHTALGYLSLAEQNLGGAEVISQARLACQQALESADAVLDNAAEERQGVTLAPGARPVDLAEALGASTARALAAGELRGVRVEPIFDARAFPVTGPQKALERLIDNLLLNAVKQSPEGGQVWARLEVQGDRVVLRVEDDGPGILEEDLEKIFTPFYRPSSGRRERAGGLGLAFGRRWANQRGGQLWAENRASGGARFILQLPLRSNGDSTAIQRADSNL